MAHPAQLTLPEILSQPEAWAEAIQVVEQQQIKNYRIQSRQISICLSLLAVVAPITYPCLPPGLCKP